MTDRYKSQEWRDNSSLRRAILTNKKRMYIMCYLAEHPCVDCGNINPAVLDFDHVRDKQYNISDILSSNQNITVLETEIFKCEVRCANCHRIKTSKEQNSYRLQSVRELEQTSKELQNKRPPLCFVRHAVINSIIVKEIKDKYNTNRYSYTDLARMYGVGKSTIANLIQGKTWKE